MTKESKFTSLSRSSLSDAGEPPYKIHGIAIGEGDVTVGQSGTKKVWEKEPLKNATDSLEGKPIVVDHENTSRSVIGKINKVRYEEGVGILYEGEIHDEEIADKIESELLEVSLRGHHEGEEEMEEDSETGALKPSNIGFENISVVPNGAAPSNSVNLGEHENLSVAALSQYFEEPTESSEEELANPPKWKEGQLVKWQVDPSLFGKIVHVDEDKHIVMVEIHNKENGELTSTGFTITAGYSDLERMKTPSREEMEEVEEPQFAEGDYVSWADGEVKAVVRDVMPGEEKLVVQVSTEEDDEGEASGQEIEVTYDQVSMTESLSLADIEEGDLVKWNSSGERDAYGKVQDTITKGMYNSEIDGDQTISAPAALIEVHKPMDEGWSATGTMVGHKTNNDTLKVIESLPEPENLSVEQLQDYTIHEPEYTGTTEGEWSRPDLEEFTDESWDDLSQDEKSDIGDHFIMSETGFPSENYGDMNLPVVEPNGDLSLSALRTVKGGHGVQAVEGASSDEEERVMEMVNMLAKEEFDEDWSEEMSKHKHLYESKEDAMQKAKEMGLDGVHKMDGMWMPGEDHESYKEASSSEYDEMAFNEPSDYEIQMPEYDGTTEKNWDSPMLHDLTDKSWEEMSEDEKSDVSDHFMLTAGSFPPEKFRWLKLAAVEPSGELNLNALRAIKGGHGASAVDHVSDEDKLEIMEMVDELASKEFGENWNSSMEDLGYETSDEDVDTRNDIEELEGQSITVFENGITYRTMTDIDTSGMDNPVAIEEEELQSLRDEVEELRSKADTVEELNDNLSELRERQEILDEVDEESLNELRETDEPVVLSESRFNELEEEVEQVKQSYASELSESMPAFGEDELAKKFTIDELSEKVEELSDETEDSDEEELSPEPKSKDKTEEEELSEDEQVKEEKLAELGWKEYAE
jgi:hypothetical protein